MAENLLSINGEQCRRLMKLFAAMVIFMTAVFKLTAQCNIPIVTNPQSGCSATLVAFGDGNAAQINWYLHSTDAYPAFSTIGNSGSKDVTSTITYYVSCVCTGLGESSKVPVSFTYNPGPSIYVTASHANPIPTDSTVTLTANGYLSSWSTVWALTRLNGPTVGTTFQLTVSSGGTYWLSAKNICGIPQTFQYTVNYQPLADAGLDQTVSSTTTSLNIYGAASDPEGQPVSISWTKVSGPSVTMAGTTTPTLGVSNLQVGAYDFRMTVTDAFGSKSDDMILTVSAISNNYNYIQREQVNLPGKTTVGQVAALTPDDKNVSIQYTDGLGRTNQVVQMQGSPARKDIIQPVEFDDLGRAKKSFLPIAGSTTTGYYHANETGIVVNNSYANYLTSDQHLFYQSGGPLAVDSLPYADQSFEPSPFGRVIQHGSPGAAWQPGVSGGYQSVSYGTNTASDVRHWTATATSLPTSIGNYPANTLNSVTSVNEQGLTTVVYSNRQGLKLLEKVKRSPTAWAETYYVYDTLTNRLRFLMPPEFIVVYPTGTSGVPVQTDVDRWCYQMIYDSLGRPAQTKSPGIGWVYTVYDGRDRAVLTQDPVERSNNQWSYVKYDAVNRPVLSGLYSPGSNIALHSMQFTVRNLNGGQGYQNVTSNATSTTQVSATVVLSAYQSINDYKATTGISLEPGFDFIAGTTAPSFHASLYNAAGTGGGPTDVFPVLGTEDLVKTYYDVYSDCEICQDTSYQFVNESWTTTSNETYQSYPYVKGNVVGSAVKVLGDTMNTWLNTVVYYNRHGQIIQTIGGNHLGGRDRISSLPDFTGKKLEELQTSIGYNSGGVNTMRKVFSYDPVGRLLMVKHQINTQPMIILSALQYNELGQVIKKNIHSSDNGSTYLQSLDYRYNIRGWLTNLNNLTTDDNNDYFGMDLTYNGTVGGAGAGNTPRTDGMISAVRWKQDLGLKKRLYNYTYDSLNRIKSSNQKMSIDNGATWTGEPDFFSETGLKYDLNGNILRLNRNAEYFNGTNYAVNHIDSLVYTYGPGSNNNGNQLQSVKDYSSVQNDSIGFRDGTNAIGDPDYTYDANGNVSKDQNKKIDSIKYYFNNLPSRVKFHNGSLLTYKYDAAGIKLSQLYYDSLGHLQTTTDYLGGFVFLNGQVLVINHSEGRISAPTYSNLIDNRDAGSTDGFTPTGTVTMGTAFVNSQTYVTAQCNQASGLPGVWPIKTTTTGSNGGLKVKVGETYMFKVQGYQSSGTNAYLFISDQSGNNIVWPGTQLPVGSGSDTTWASTAGFTIPAGVTEIKVGVLWNGGGIGNTIYINRVALYKIDFEYNYFIADQVGSNRVVLQTNPGTQTYMATMETENQATESSQFQHLTYSQVVVFSGANHTPGGNESIKLNSTFRVGPSKSIKVYPGDKIDASVYSYYSSSSGYTKTPLASMLPVVAAAFGGYSGVIGDPGAIFNNVNNIAGNSWIAGLSPDEGPTRPSAYLNYILFDKDYLPIGGMSKPVSGTPNVPMLDSLPTITAPELGYVFIYLSYDNDTGGDVFFDDLKITVQESPVIEVNNYYPFGLKSYTWLRPGETENAYLFQGKELIAQTGWHDFGSRMYWSDLGRWFGKDPKNQFSSPYLALGNVPMMGIDPNGEKCGFCDWVKKNKAVIGQIAVAVAIGVLTDGLGDIALFGEGTVDISVTAIQTVAGALTGGAQSVIKGNRFGSKSFLDDVAIGAIGGAAFGATDKFVDADKLLEFRGPLAAKATQSFFNGAAQGFSTGVASAVKEGGHNFLRDIEMGASGALQAGAINLGATLAKNFITSFRVGTNNAENAPAEARDKSSPEGFKEHKSFEQANGELPIGKQINMTYNKLPGSIMYNSAFGAVPVLAPDLSRRLNAYLWSFQGFNP